MPNAPEHTENAASPSLPSLGWEGDAPISTREHAGVAAEANARERKDVIHYDYPEDDDALDFLGRFALRMSREDPESPTYDPHEPEPLYRDDIEVVQTLCTKQHTGCNRCQLVCPHQAIDLSGAYPRIIDERCTNCGLCAGICDGFSSTRFTLDDIAARAKRMNARGETPTFACADAFDPGQDPSPNAIVIGCLAQMPPELWASLLMRDVRVSAYCNERQCAACVAAGGDATDLYAHAIATAEAWTDGSVTFTTQKPAMESLLDSLGMAAESEGRRGLLRSLGSTAANVTSGERRRMVTNASRDFHAKRERMRAEGHIRQGQVDELPIGFDQLANQQRLWPRRALLIQHLKLTSPKPSIPVWTSCTDHERCDHTGACIEHCPTGARRRDESGTVQVDARYCIACGTCMSMCPVGACDYQETTTDAF